MKSQITIELMVSMGLSVLIAVSFISIAAASNLRALSMLNWSGKALCGVENSYASLLRACQNCLPQQSQQACTEAG